MTRKSREFSLVLLGAGILTAGYFYYSQNNEMLAKEEEQAKKQVNGSRPYHGGALVFIHGGGYSGGRASSPALASGITRGGFGGIGSRSAAS